MMSSFVLIIPVMLGSVYCQYVPYGPLPPLQMYYQPQPQFQQNQAYQPSQGYPFSQVSSVYTFPAPNPVLVFRNAAEYQTDSEPIPKGRRKPLLPEIPYPEAEHSTASSFDPKSTPSDLITPPQFNSTASTNPEPGYNDNDPDQDSYPIPVNVIPNRSGSSYPMQLTIPILPNLTPVRNPGYSVFMMPMQFYYNPVPLLPVTSSPLSDLKTMSAPLPEVLPETTPMSTEVITDITSPAPTIILEEQQSVTEAQSPVPNKGLVSEATSTTPVPISYSSLDYSSLPTYFNAIYSNSATYASSYSNYIKITKYQRNDTADGYQVHFETENGIKSVEEGHLKTISLEDQIDQNSSNSYNNTEGHPSSGIVHVKSGQVIWTSPECITFTLKYTADERGYRPKITESPNEECLIVYGTVNNEISDSAPPSPL